MFQDVERNWSPGSLSGDIKSHPDRTLKDHLEGTFDLMKSLTEANKLEAFVPQEILKAVGTTHDLGKSHHLFQEYLNGRGKGVDHSLPSAWFTLNQARYYANSKDLPLIWMVESVRRHHTHMVDAKSSVRSWASYKPSMYLDHCVRMKELIPNWDEFMTAEEWEFYSDSLILDEEDFISEDHWLFYRLLYSLLITSDRMDAIGIRSLNVVNMPALKLPDFSSKEPSPLDEWRTEVHILCMKAVQNFNSPGLFTLTLPTGAGKTITGLDIAHTIAEQCQSKTIIYAMPFISIIEQNSSVAMELFGKDNVQEDHSKGYIQVEELNSKSPWSRMQNIFRYWRSPIILTTMVQLWDSIYSPKANDSMDFHRLSNAVVLMDEPQTVNPRYWSGFGKTLEFLSNKFGITFIMMTATQPHMIHGTEIAPRTVEFPFNRHRYSVLPGKHELKSLPDLIDMHIDDFKVGSGLVVLNTRVSALQAYLMLKQILLGPVLFLSTWMIPRHRRKIMTCLRYLEKKSIQHYLISTQAVEAGVDLDFDWVFRDMGPLDSIVQVAGRCNRHSKKQNPGTVLVAELKNEKNKSFCDMVYDDILLDSSRTTLQQKDAVHVFEEASVSDMINSYYLEISERLKDEPIWENICTGKWGPDSKFDLIKDDRYRNTEKIYIEYDSDLRPLLKKLTSTKWSLENLEEKRILNRKAEQYMIEVPSRELGKWREKLASIQCHDELPLVGYVDTFKNWFITKEGCKFAYDRITGFIPADLVDGNVSYDPLL